MITLLYQRIIAYLEKNKIQFQLFEHEPVYTSETASKVLNHAEEEGTKSLALQAGNNLIVVTISGNERIDFKKIKKIVLYQEN
ncbi:hypothetical protein ACX27_00500 [Nostoc piscinale CENA21]|uniref:YbaK/aminoacyl-tRNA synthetase-associated domain-containing protein n=1 Tax=Nostoc piscinale CENA21 TaxID=224013 RepID=A0A0M4T0N4_9NOSO|nr:YbaK/EbsC family protein [Nostoc piscinale]ALF51666.1 hypothetical protein ACX27_00500 [Nostoc piscinale CENA21]